VFERMPIGMHELKSIVEQFGRDVTNLGADGICRVVMVAREYPEADRGGPAAQPVDVPATTALPHKHVHRLHDDAPPLTLAAVLGVPLPGAHEAP
jgi:hypothetical protein